MTAGNETNLQRRSEVEALKWFHAIDFGDFSSSGRFPKDRAQNITLFGAMEFLNAIKWNGVRALDIGTSDGLAAFGMKALGAETVSAIDTYDLKSFRLARELLDLEIDYHPKLQIKDAIDQFGWKQFDAILCAGVIYHMLNPLSAFTECRKLIKDNGLLIMESPVHDQSDDPVLILNTEHSDFLPEIATYWVPTKSAMLGMMKLAGFDVIATRQLKAPSRLTVIGRAAAPSEIKNRSEILEKIHDYDFCDYTFRLDELGRHEGVSAIEISALDRDRDIHAQKEKPNFPYHPQAGRQGLGTTRWFSKSGNY